MARCQEFGIKIGEGCSGLMVAGSDSCTCEACGTRCTGKFSGCPDVWARGPAGPVVTGRTIARRRGVAPITPAPDEPVPVSLPETGDSDHRLGQLIAEQRDILAGLGRQQELIVASQDELADRILDDVRALLAAQTNALADVQRGISAAMERQQTELDRVSGQHRRVEDHLASAKGSVSAEARQDFFLTRIEQVTHHLSQTLSQAVTAIGDLRAVSERLAGAAEALDASARQPPASLRSVPHDAR